MSVADDKMIPILGLDVWVSGASPGLRVTR